MASTEIFKKWQDKQAELTNLINTLPGEEEAETSKIKGETAYDEKRKSYEGINKTILDTEKRLSGVRKNVNDRFAGSGRLVTNAQQDRVVGVESGDIAEELAGVSRTAQGMRDEISGIDNRISQAVSNVRNRFNTRKSAIDTESDTLLTSYKDESARETAQLLRDIEERDKAWERKQREDEFNWQKQQAAEDLRLKKASLSNQSTKPSMQENEYATMFEAFLAEGKYSEAADLADYYKKNGTIVGFGKKTETPNNAYRYDAESDSVLGPNGYKKASTVKNRNFFTDLFDKDVQKDHWLGGFLNKIANIKYGA